MQLADRIDWERIDAQLADCFSSEGRPGTEVRLMIGLFLLKHTYGLSDGQVCDRRWRILTSTTSPARRSSSTVSRTSARR